MKKSTLLIATCLFILVGCGAKKNTESNTESGVSVEEIEKLEASADEAENLSQEIEQSAQELDDLLNDLDNIEEK